MDIRRWMTHKLLLALLVMPLVLSACGDQGDSSMDTDSGMEVTAEGTVGQDDRQSHPDEQQRKTMADLNRTAENMFFHTRDDKPELARAELNALSRTVANMPFTGLTTVEGIEALTAAIVDAKRVFSAARFDQKQALLAAGKIRLAVDALDRSRRPMWLEYEKVFQTDVNELREALADDDLHRLQQVFACTQSHFTLIRPSVLISRDPAVTSAIDSLLHAMQDKLENGSLDHFRSLIEHYGTITHEMFSLPLTTSAADDDDSLPAILIGGEPRPVLWTVTIGAVIVSALSYVGWRRYRYERDHVLPVKKGRDFGD